MQNNSTQSLPVPAIGVSGIVFNNQKQVLMIQRNQPPAMGFWSIPGGKLEPGESLAEACQREIKEETGLETNVKNIVAIVERRIEGFHYVIIDYLALLTDEENIFPIAQSDVAEQDGLVWNISLIIIWWQDWRKLSHAPTVSIAVIIWQVCTILMLQVLTILFLM